MCLAAPAKVKNITGDTATVDFGGVARSISLGILSGVKKGDYVLVHAGFAIGKVEKKEAEDTMESLRELKNIVSKEMWKRESKKAEKK
jgi:hydrogenase expression/formation protein HypC